MQKLRDNNVIIEGAERSTGAATILIQIIPWVIGFAFIWFHAQTDAGRRQ